MASKTFRARLQRLELQQEGAPLQGERLSEAVQLANALRTNTRAMRELSVALRRVADQCDGLAGTPKEPTHG